MDLEKEVKSLKRELKAKDDACTKAENETSQLKNNNKKNEDEVS